MFKEDLLLVKIVKDIHEINYFILQIYHLVLKRVFALLITEINEFVNLKFI